MTKTKSGDEPFLPEWVSEILITTIVASSVFYFYYDDISVKWRFWITSILSIIYTVGIYFSLPILSIYLSNKRKNGLFMATCREAGIDPNSQDEDDAKKYRAYLVNRYSSEKFVNRITDLIGTILSIVSVIIESITLISIISLIIYLPVKGYYSEDLLMWLPIMGYVIFLVIFSVISFLCKLLFNRYPSEASGFNKEYQKIIR